MSEIFVQIIGFIGVLCAIIAYQQKSDKRLFLLSSLEAAIFALQFYMLGAYAGSIMCALGSTRSLTAAFFRHKILSIIFPLIYIIFGISTIETTLDAVPLVGGIIISASAFLLTGLKLRISFFIAFSCWLYYSIMIGSYGAIITESMHLISNLIGMYRLFIKPNKSDI